MFERELGQRGIKFEVENGGKHPRVCFEANGARVELVAPTSAGDRRAALNARAFLRRRLRDVGFETLTRIDYEDEWRRAIQSNARLRDEIERSRRQCHRRKIERKQMRELRDLALAQLKLAREVVEWAASVRLPEDALDLDDHALMRALEADSDVRVDIPMSIVRKARRAKGGMNG